MKRFNSRQSILASTLIGAAALTTGCTAFQGIAARGVSSLSGIRTATVGGVGQDDDVTISKVVNGAPLSIRSSGRMAGAIDSVQWNGFEFIDSADHGRELQSASSFDELGECFNPTEAGGRDDAFYGSSQLLARSTPNASELLTQSNMAFWLPPRSEYSPYTCGTSGLHTAQNDTVLSGHILEKHLTIGYRGLDNVVDYLIKFRVPEAHSKARFEANTAYMPESFANSAQYDPASGGFQPLQGDGTVRSLPVVMYTNDGNYAMGVISPELTRNPRFESGYATWSASLLGGGPSAHVVKWACVFTETSVPVGEYNYECLTVVGTRDQVFASIKAIYQMNVPPVAAPAPVAQAPVVQAPVVQAPPAAVVPAPVAPAVAQATASVPAVDVVYRLYRDGDYLFSKNPGEGVADGYHLEGGAFQIARTAGPGLIPVYRCYIPAVGHHFLSHDGGCEGQAQDGLLGYFATSGLAGAHQTYRRVHPATGAHLITSDPNEGSSLGYVTEGAFGYAW